MNRKIVLTGAILIVLSIIFGAFGAHALKKLVSAEHLLSFETGVRYQMYQGLALFILGFNAEKVPFQLKAISVLLLAGIVLFSGSIYLLALQDPLGLSLRFLGPVTPLGGILMIAGWSYFILKLLPRRSRQQ